MQCKVCCNTLSCECLVYTPLILYTEYEDIVYYVNNLEQNDGVDGTMYFVLMMIIAICCCFIFGVIVGCICGVIRSKMDNKSLHDNQV